MTNNSSILDSSSCHSDYTPFRYTASDGLQLAGRKYGWENRERPALVCLAGLTRNSHDFHALACYLAHHPKAPRRVLSLDYRGRGESGHDSDWNNYNPITEADDTLQGITAAGLGHVHILGTSRGGMIAMILGAMRPSILKSVILNDIGPEIDGPALVRIKHYVENAKMPTSHEEAVDFLKRGASRQFTAFGDEDWENQVRWIYKEGPNGLERRYDPKLVNTLKSINLDVRLPTMWPQFKALGNLPLLAMRGENTDLITMETINRMKAIKPDMEYLSVPGQGHAPDVGFGDLPETISKFLTANDH